ncbi:MAG: hypothetical protein Q9191_006189 [Dirinaria sp. TL-2023a]
MPKRKLEQFSDQDDLPLSASNATAIQRRGGGIDAIIDNGKKALCRAMKVSRGFERQKLGRRQKTAKAQNAASETARLAEEVRALKVGHMKELDLLSISETHLYKSLMKSKPISTHPAFPTYVAKKLAQPFEYQDVASANVTARLMNANPVKAVMADLLANVYKELGVPSDERPRKKKRLRVADFKGKSLSSSQKPPNDLSETQKAVQTEYPNNQAQGNQANFSGEPGEQEPIESDDESINYDAYRSRLAESEDESDSADEGGVKVARSHTPSHDNWPQKVHDTIPTYIPSQSLSPSSSSRSQSPPQAAFHPVSKPAKTPSLPKAPTKQTTFLPSLIGGYWSGSDSAPEDEETPALKPRKNRRGQQERRAIWEKKFGSRAKHIQQQQQQQQTRERQPQDRNAGWDARRGASSDARGKMGQGGRGARRGMGRDSGAKRGTVSSGANSDPLGGERKGGAWKEGPLHPSWEAKKRAKEKAGSGNAVAFQGKKVVF